jgi:hypothetical protein
VCPAGPPNLKVGSKEACSVAEQNQEVSLRKSPRLKGKNSKGKFIVMLAQDLIAKKYGVISDNEALDSMTLQ